MGMAVTLETVAIVAAASNVAFVAVVPFLALAALRVLNGQRGKQQEGMLVCTIYTIYTSRPLVFPNFPNMVVRIIGGLYIAQGCLRRNSQKNISFYCSSPKGK